MQKPRLSFCQIWNMSFGFLCIQFGWGLQLANMSPIYKYLHAEESSLPYLWLAGPITGLIIQPIIGSMSDRTWNKLGRRRPYFLAGAILASVALFFMPDSSAVWMAAGLLWILDASINITPTMPSAPKTKGKAFASVWQMPIKKLCMTNPSVRCSSGSLSATNARNGSIVMLMLASSIQSRPAAIQTADELGMKKRAVLARSAPARK